MKKNYLKKIMSCSLAVMLAVTMLPTTIAKADNPIIQTYYTADPSPMVVGDELYVFTSHDEDVIQGNFYTMENWRCVSTKDMVNWTDHGVILDGADYSWESKAEQRRSWACQCVERDGKYYLYTPLLRASNNGGGSPGYGIGVAVSDNPYGPFEDAIGKPLIEGNWTDIDPTVYVDDDGQAYLFYGQTLKYCLLNDDMISLKTQPKEFKVPNYTEGPWFTKHDDMYYFIWAGNGGAVSSAHKGGENLQYAYCDEALGSYTYGGILQETTRGNSFTNHPGVTDFKGHSYLFYHTNELPGGSSYHRSVCVDEFEYNDDGTITLVPMTESVDPIGTLNPYEQVEAETICKEVGLKTGWTKFDEGHNHVYVYNTHDGDYWTVREVDFGDAGAIKFTAAIKDCKDDADASIEVYTTDDDNLIATIDCDNDSDEWKEVTVDLDEKLTGKHDLKFVVKGSYSKPGNEAPVSEEDTGMFKIDYWKFTAEVIEPTPAPATAAPTAAPAAPAQPTVAPSADNNKAVPAKVKIKSVKKSGKNVKVVWNKAANATKYQVAVSTKKNGKYTVKLNVKAPKTNGVVKKLKKNKTYFFKVRGVNAASGKSITGKYSSAKKIKL